MEVVEWLAREKLDKSSYDYAINLSRGAAYPNERGLEIQQHIKRSEARIIKADGFQLARSGSIGRWLAFSDDHCYLVTTVAAVSRFRPGLCHQGLELYDLGTPLRGTGEGLQHPDQEAEGRASEGVREHRLAYSQSRPWRRGSCQRSCVISARTVATLPRLPTPTSTATTTARLVARTMPI